jgi:hypothetical protein
MVKKKKVTRKVTKRAAAPARSEVAPQGRRFGDAQRRHALVLVASGMSRVQVAATSLAGLTSNNPAFALSGLHPNFFPGGIGWQLTFRPTTVGTQSATLSFSPPSDGICAPGSSVAVTGEGVASAGD